jgi:hypothetical protein
VRGFAIAISVGLGACSGPSQAGSHALADELRERGAHLQDADTRIGHLAWHPTGSCTHVYRISAAYEPPLRFEQANDAFLAIAARDPQHGRGPVRSAYIDGAAFYRGVRAENSGLFRTVHLGPTQFGPLAPTAACTPKTWDPIEDAFALGWPKLTGRLTAIGESWVGHRVEGRCNRSACVNPKTGGVGPEDHDRTCVTMSWSEELVDLFEVDEQRYALIRGTWMDGHLAVGDRSGPGIWAERFALVSIEHGRPTWARATIYYGFTNEPVVDGFAPVERTWQLQSIDACAGGLARIGWQFSLDMPTIADQYASELGAAMAKQAADRS